MMDHEELVREMQILGETSVSERIRLARKRRLQQLEQYWQRTKGDACNHASTDPQTTRVKFDPEVLIMEAAFKGDVVTLKDLLEAGLDPNIRDYQAMTPLHQSCIEGHPEAARLLLHKEANVNARDSDGWTPLHVAATCDHVNIAALLVGAGGDLLAMNDDGEMPFQITDNEDLIHFLKQEMAYHGITEQMVLEKQESMHTRLLKDVHKAVKIGKDLDHPVTEDGATFLHIAVANSDHEVFKLLIKYGASFEIEDNEGWRPIHVAAFWGNEKALKQLVKQDVDIMAKTHADETAYDLSENKTKYFIQQLLVKYRSINTINNHDSVNGTKYSKEINPSHNMTKRAKLRRASVEDVLILKPLLNLAASERSSDRKISFRETKKHGSHRSFITDRNEEIQNTYAGEQYNLPDIINHNRIQAQNMIESDDREMNQCLLENLAENSKDVFVNKNLEQTSIQISKDIPFHEHSLPYLKRTRLREREKKEGKLNRPLKQELMPSKQTLLSSPNGIQYSFKESDNANNSSIIEKATRKYYINCRK